LAIADADADKYGMTRRLETLFDLPPADNTVVAEEMATESAPDKTHAAIVEIDLAIDKIDAALPAVRDLEASDRELDDIAAKATETFENLTDLGFNVDSRYSAELFAVASTMLGHALTAKTTKLQKKLKVLELQMKKLKLDQDTARQSETDPVDTAHGRVMTRNDLLEMLKNNRDQNNTTA
jgi:hypothetical protein